jgi:hypothetical protein
MRWRADGVPAKRANKLEGRRGESRGESNVGTRVQILAEIRQGGAEFRRESLLASERYPIHPAKIEYDLEVSQLIESFRHNLMATQVELELVVVD